MTGKITIVAGGTSPLGMGIVRSLLAAGALVIVPASNAHDILLLKDYVADLVSGKLITFLTDLSDYDKVSDITDFIEAFGPVDLAVSFMQRQAVSPFLTEVEMLDWQHMLDENVTSCFVGSQAILNTMKDRHHGMFISIHDTDNFIKRAYSALINFAANAQMELSNIFSAEVKDYNITYYNLFVNNIIKPGMANAAVAKKDWITPEVVGQHIIALFNGKVDNPLKSAQAIMGKPASVPECINKLLNNN